MYFCNMKYKKELIQSLVSESNSVTEILIKLNLRAAGGNYKTIKKYISMYSLDTSHFETERKKQILSLSLLKKIPMSDILVENSSYCRGSLKKRLYESNLKKRQCEMCGQGEYWNKRKMSLILDHINGVHNDNRLSNLRILCPNCNATLDTHCGKNASNRNLKLKKLNLNQNSKIDLRKIGDYNRDEFVEKSIKKQTVKRPDYKDLIKDIDNLGYVKTGIKYGVSDNAIRKWVSFYKKYIINKQIKINI